MIGKSLTIAACLCMLASLDARVAQGQGGSAERFVLSGVIVYEGGGLAWIQEPSLTGDRPVAFRLSDTIGPYRLTKILDDRVELEGPTGTILVPVFNAQAGPGPAVAMGPQGAAPSGAPAAAQGRAASPGPVPPTVAPQAAPMAPQPAPVGARTLRGQLDIARKHVQQLQSAGQVAGQQTGTPQPGQVGAPEPSIGGTNGTGVGSGTGGHVAPVVPRDAPLLHGGNPAPQATNQVVTPQKGQTFQGILGLK